MALRSARLALISSSFIARVASQQGVLVNGNSQLPTCAQTCPKLMQAAQACSAITTASQSSWVCFCQSAYLSTLAQSNAGICDDVCTDSADGQQLSTWYQSNCGTDHGQSEHADAGSGATTTAAGLNPITTTAAPGTTNTAAAGSSSSSSSHSSGGGTWWDTHYKWIIMLIVLVVTLPLLAFILVVLKRRHDRKRDQIRGGFNAGITARSAPTDPRRDVTGFAAGSADASGRNSPARTREAFMPYGYGYSRSESRLASGQIAHEDRRSPLAHGETAVEESGNEKMVGVKKSKRILVRERSSEDAIEREKGHR